MQVWNEMGVFGNEEGDTDAAEVAVVVSALLLVVVSATIGAANALD